MCVSVQHGYIASTRLSINDQVRGRFVGQSCAALGSLPLWVGFRVVVDELNVKFYCARAL